MNAPKPVELAMSRGTLAPGSELHPSKITDDSHLRAGSRPCALRWLPLLIFVSSLGLGLSVLYVSHPHEDAYILFKYVRNFTSGLGIVFNAGGPHAEGATDFLWFALLSAFTWIGFDVAVA